MAGPRQRGRTSKANSETPDLFRLLVESVQDDAIFVLDTEGHVISWNKGAERIIGYQPAEILRKSVSVFYPPDDARRGAPERLLQEAARSGRSEDEGWRVRKDGTRFWADVILTALRDEQGSLLGFAQVTHDLTERRRIEEALAESEARYRVAVNAASDAIITIDQDDTILFVNPATEAIFGYRAEELVGQDLTMLMPEDLRQRHLDGFHRYLATGTRTLNWKAVEFQGLHRSGREVPLELAFGEFERDGRRLFIGYARDVTARKQAQAERDRLREREQAVAAENARLYEQVQETLRVREEFMAAAAHELKTPVTVISGQAQLLLRAGPSDEHLRRVLTTIVQQSNRIALLIEDLLSSVRVRPGSVKLNRERFDLSDLVTDLVERMDRSTPEHSFAIEAPPPLFVDADRSLIAEVVNRLMENARRYSSEGGRIEVRVFREGGNAMVSVTDHGAGIVPERLPHVFEPFYEPVPAGMPGYVGIVSLGLLLSREIVEAHGGKIWATSTLGAGSTFSFSLPAPSS